jgi:beta-1,3-glucuronyltransferase
VITPTYPRYAQIAELTRLGQTLQHVQNLIWIVAEDAKYPTEQGCHFIQYIAYQNSMYM